MQRTMASWLCFNQIALGDVVGAVFGAEDQEAVEPRPIKAEPLTSP
jgi:hypothetical protein